MDAASLARKIKEIGDISKRGWTPLAFWADRGDIDVVRALLDKGVPVDGLTTEEVTPLQYASQNGHSDVVLLLIERGADVNFEGTRLSTPLMRACNGGHTEAIRILLEKGADPNYGKFCILFWGFLFLFWLFFFFSKGRTGARERAVFTVYQCLMVI